MTQGQSIPSAYNGHYYTLSLGYDLLLVLLCLSSSFLSPRLFLHPLHSSADCCCCCCWALLAHSESCAPWHQRPE